MSRGSKTVTVDRQKAKNYKVVADNFYDGAEAAAEYEYWNAAGVFTVQAHLLW